MHPAPPERGVNGAAKRAEQSIDLGPGELADRASGIDLRGPQHLIRQEVADTGNGVLIEQSRLHRRRAAARHDPSELSRRDGGRIRTGNLDRRIEPNSAEPPRVDQHQRAAIGEGQGEPAKSVVAKCPSSLPVVTSVDLAAIDISDDDLAGHAEVDSQGWAGYARTTDARGLAPHALPLAVGSCQSPPDQRGSDLTRLMWTAHIAVRVVHVDDSATDCRALDYCACGLNLRQLRHKHDLAWCRLPAVSGPPLTADEATTAPRLRLSARTAPAVHRTTQRGGVQCLAVARWRDWQ